MDETLLTYKEIAARLRVSPKTVRRQVAAGLIQAMRCGRRILFDWSIVRSRLPDAQPAMTAGRYRRLAQGAPRPTLMPMTMTEHLKQKANATYQVPDELAAMRQRKERTS